MSSDNQFTALGTFDLPTKFGFFTDANNLPFGVNELLASIFIMAASSALFLYWFRYTCLLILQQKSVEDTLRLTSTISLISLEINKALQALRQAEVETRMLDRLHQSLDHDYRILTELLPNATGTNSIKRRMLTADYGLMQMCYRLTRSSRKPLARKALGEMSAILGYFAAEIVEESAA